MDKTSGFGPDNLGSTPSGLIINFGPADGGSIPSEPILLMHNFLYNFLLIFT